jgi:pentatricopeptide repeat protein
MFPHRPAVVASVTGAAAVCRAGNNVSPDIVSFNCLLTGLCAAKQISGAFTVYDSLASIGLTPTATTVRILIGPALAYGLYDRVLALWTHLQTLDGELEPSDVHAVLQALVMKVCAQHAA